MNFSDAQRDMRHGYFCGAPGILASATAWLIAGFVAMQGTPKSAVVALFIGGMFIHPVGVIVAKMLGRRGSHTKGNPLATLAAEGTIFFLLCLPLAYAVFLYHPRWFFPAMLLLIGGRYLTFATIYGMRTFWVCGGTLALAGVTLLFAKASASTGAFTGAAIEFVFAAIVFALARRESTPQPVPQPGA